LLADLVDVPLGDPDEVPEVPAGEPETQVGDVWELGNHRLLCGDATSAGSFAALLGGGDTPEKVDMLLTDPPYGVDYVANYNSVRKATGGRKSEHREIENDTEVEGGYRAWFGSWLSLVPWKNPSVFYVFMAGQKLHELREAIDDCGFKWGDYLIWLKNAAVFGRKDYKAQSEWIVQGWPTTGMSDATVDERTPEFVLYGWAETHRFYGPKNATNVLEYPRPKKNDLHPTMKPVAMLEQLLTDGSPQGSVVLDCFGGSGSTMIACESVGRKCRMLELDPRYCDVIKLRWEQFTGKKGVRIPHG
jgi:DNA modification methylase